MRCPCEVTVFSTQHSDGRTHEKTNYTKELSSRISSPKPSVPAYQPIFIDSNDISTDSWLHTLHSDKPYIHTYIIMVKYIFFDASSTIPRHGKPGDSSEIPSELQPSGHADALGCQRQIYHKVVVHPGPTVLRNERVASQLGKSEFLDDFRESGTYRIQFHGKNLNRNR